MNGQATQFLHDGDTPVKELNGPGAPYGLVGRYQANFERRFEGQLTREWQSNGHLELTNMP